MGSFFLGKEITRRDPDGMVNLDLNCFTKQAPTYVNNFEICYDISV